MPDAKHPLFTAEQLAEARRLMALYPDKRGALLPVLHLAQDTFGYVSLEVEEYVAGLFELSPAHVHEVATFYTMFFKEPVGRHVVAVCHNLTCHLLGAKAVIEHLKERLGVEPGETTADGRVTLLTVECLCACEQAPMMQVDDRYEGLLTSGKVDQILGGAPVTTSEKIFTRNFHLADSHTLDRYRGTGGYTALGKALSMEPAAITEEVKKSNLRGLGGAAFPTGVKWGFIPKGSTAPKYLVINADEGEPGTFKDRYLLERDPHGLVEGMIIAARAIGSHLGFVYIRGEYVQPWRIFSGAVKEAYAAGLLGKNIQGSGFDFDIVIHRGAGAYICGEETGLLSSLEGKKGWPKIKPPFPAVKGAFGHPTIVNNVETIAAVPHIINRGAEWFAGLGTKTQGGTRLYSVSGHVVKPGVVEASVSTTLRSLIYDHSGGIRDGRRLKAVVPGGSSAPILTADEIDVVMDADGLKTAGSMIGSAGVIVFDDTVSIPEALMVVARFYAHESCGQCTPCRESTGWIYKMAHRIVEGKGRKEDLDTILDIAKRGAGTTICAFYDGAVGPYVSYIEKFREEFESLIRSGARA